MARRKSGGTDGISLFPFMSILVCLIGSLTLMITSLMASAMNTEQSDEVVERHQEHSELLANIEQGQAELESLQKLIAEALRLEEDARRASEEVAALENQHEERLRRLDENSEYARMLAEANRLRKRITEIENDPEKLQKEIERLQQEIEKRNAGPDEAVVQIRPGGSGVDIKPTFVECTSNGLVVHEGDEPRRIRSGDIRKSDGDFARLLDRVAGTRKGQVLFLVRPDGVGTYNTARSFARSHHGPNGYCTIGKLPVPTQGNIDLSIFGK